MPQIAMDGFAHKSPIIQSQLCASEELLAILSLLQAETAKAATEQSTLLGELEQAKTEAVAGRRASAASARAEDRAARLQSQLDAMIKRSAVQAEEDADALAQAALDVRRAQVTASKAAADREAAMAELGGLRSQHEDVYARLTESEVRAAKAEKALKALRRQFALESKKWHAEHGDAAPSAGVGGVAMITKHSRTKRSRP